MILAVLASGPAGCRRAKSPDAAYQEIVQESRHGAIGQAQQDADREYRRYANKEPDQAWRFRVLEAQLLVLRKSNREALALLEEDPPQSLRATEVAARRRMVQGLASDYLEQYDNAERYFAEAERLAGSYAPRLLGDITMSRGSLALDEHKYDQAELDFRRALSIAREQNVGVHEVEALGSLALTATKEEHYDESVDWNRQTLEAARSIGAKAEESKALGNMGWNYFEMGDFENAIEMTKQAEEAAARTGLVGDRTYWLSQVGVYYYAQRDYKAAAAALQQALALARSANDQPTTAKCLNDLSLVALDTGQIGDAEKYNEEALNLERPGGDHSAVIDSQVVAGRIEMTKGRFAQAERLFENAIHDPQIETSLRWEAEARLGEAYARTHRSQEAQRSFRRSIETVEAARSSVKTEEFRLSFLSSAIDVYSNYIDFLVGDRKPADALQIAELSRARTLAEGLKLSSNSLSFPNRRFDPIATAKRLNAVILSYWLGAQHSYLWVVTPAGLNLIPLPPAQEIDSLVQSYRQALVGPRDVLETANPAGRKLYDLLVAPAGGHIRKGSRVVVIPDGSLYRLNFETLLVSQPAPHYWIDDVTLAKANSLILLAAWARPEPAAKQKKLLLIGDPVPASSDFPELRQAASEMKEIENHFPPPERTVISGASATPQAYVASHPGDFSFVHFVAHGIASRKSPLDSAVILTKQGDAYKLYARDIVTQPLRADLVSISACNGAGERTYSGEGLVGLNWAFLRAGARQVISALWEVDDNSTSQLMSRLYAELSKGTPPETALRDAKLTLLHSGSVYSKPFYWAPFEIYRGP